MVARILLVLSFALVLFAAPASAADGTAQVPEGSSLTLFALGLAGVMIGRRFSSRKREDKNAED